MTTKPKHKLIGLNGLEVVKLPETNPWGELEELPTRRIKGVWVFRVRAEDFEGMGGLWVTPEFRPQLRQKYPAISAEHNGEWWSYPYDCLAVAAEFPSVVAEDRLVDFARMAMDGADMAEVSHPVKRVEFMRIAEILTDHWSNL